MSGISVPFIKGSVTEYAHGLDRLDALAHPHNRSTALEWTRTLATCALLVAALLQVLPWLPDTLYGQAADALAQPTAASAPTSVPGAASAEIGASDAMRAPAVVRLEAGDTQPTMMPTEHQITAKAALDKVTEAAMASPAARMLKF